MTVAQQGVIKVHTAATTNANGTTVSVGDSAGAIFTITVAGGFDGTVNFEGSLDGFTTSSAVLATKISDQTQSSTATAAGSWFVPATGFNQLRARISGRTTGTVTVIARVTNFFLARKPQGTVTHSVGALTAGQLVVGNGAADLKTTPVLIEPNVSLTDNGSTIATNAALGNNFRVTALTANVTLSNPTNPTDGQIVTWEVIQNASAAKTLAFDTKFKFGAEVTSCIVSTTLSSHDFITAIYNSTADLWYVRGCVTGY